MLNSVSVIALASGGIGVMMITSCVMQRLHSNKDNQNKRASPRVESTLGLLAGLEKKLIKNKCLNVLRDVYVSLRKTFLKFFFINN